MKTSHAIAWAGGTVKLAAIFEITHSAISQWGEEVPRPRQFELRFKRPKWFNRDGTLKSPPVEAAEQAPAGAEPGELTIVGLAPTVSVAEPSSSSAPADPASVFPGA